MNNENKNDIKRSKSKVTNKSNKPRLSLEKRNEYLQRMIELSRKENITVLSNTTNGAWQILKEIYEIVYK